MALIKEEHENLLRAIAETGGATDNMLELIQKLRDDYDEREGMLKRYEEDKDKTVEFNVDDWVKRSDYDELRRKYLDRFFGKEVEEIKDEEKEPDVKTIDDLFERKD